MEMLGVIAFNVIVDMIKFELAILLFVFFLAYLFSSVFPFPSSSF